MSGVFSDSLGLGWQMLLRDYRIRFRRAFLGMLWTLVPMVTVVALAVSIGGEVGLYAAEEKSSYTMRLLVGIVLWQIFIDSWFEPLRLARRARTYVKHVTFNAFGLIAGGVASALVNLAVKLPVVIAAFVYFQVPVPASAWIALPGGIGLLALGAGLAALLLPASLVIADVRYMQPFMQYAGLFATPIFYDMRTEGVLGFINTYNPLSYLVPTTRDLILGLPGDHLAAMGVSTLCGLLLAAGGFLYFHNKFRLIVAHVGR